MQNTEQQVIKSDINTITRIKLAPFFDKNPELWFIIAESQFNLHKSIKDDDKFNHTLAALPQDVALSVIDILKNTDATVPRYDNLKKALIDRHSLSKEKRLDNLLSTLNEMGDQSPSEFFRLLFNQVGDSDLIDKELIKRIWLKRLPHALRTSVAAWADKPTEEILPIADKIWEVSLPSSTIAETSCSYSPNRTKSSSTLTPTEQKLAQEISEIKKLLTNLDIDHRGRNRYRTPNRSNTNYYSRSKRRPRSSSRNAPGLCYFHNKFGSQARKCRKPCTYKTETPSVTNHLN